MIIMSRILEDEEKRRMYMITKVLITQSENQ